MIIYEFGIRRNFEPLWRAHIWAVERLISIHCTSGDFRWGIAALALRSFAALEVFAQKQLASLARNIMGRAWQGARFAADHTHADTMVAAAGS